jgi:N-acetylmuramoyl-L-alanine amidase
VSPQHATRAVGIRLFKSVNTAVLRPNTQRRSIKVSRRVCISIAIWALVCSPVHATRGSEPAPSAVAKSAPISNREAAEFVKEYYAELSRSDISGVVAKFGESVNYGEDRQRDRAYIEKDLRDYVARWPVLNLKPEVVAVSPKDDGGAALTFGLVYSVANESNKKSGHSTNTWIVRRVNGEIKIVSQHEVVHANPIPAIDKPPHNQSHEDDEALSDEELRKRGDIQIEIPTAKESKPSIAPEAKAAHKSPADFIIALDIGHTPLRGGAISARGVFEYRFNRRLVAELFAQLQAIGFIRAFVINPQGDEISLVHRSAEANQQKADLFLAIHHDSVKDKYLKNWEFDGKTQKYCDDFHGYSIFISRKNAKADESIQFADKLGRALLDAGLTPTLHHVAQENRPILDRTKGIYAFDDLVVLKTAKMPALLLECGVIVNRAEEEKLNNAVYRERLIEAIGRAVQSFAQTVSTAP